MTIHFVKVGLSFATSCAVVGVVVGVFVRVAVGVDVGAVVGVGIEVFVVAERRKRFCGIFDLFLELEFLTLSSYTFHLVSGVFEFGLKWLKGKMVVW